VAIKPPTPTDEVCTGNCWELHLCSEYRWGCIPKGRVFGHRAYPGANVFFVFKQPDGKYTLWGETTVHSIDDKPLDEGRDDEMGFAFIHFNQFEPIPREKWVINLTDIQLVDEKWLMGRYRYINSEREAYLEQLIEGPVPENRAKSLSVAPRQNSRTLNISVVPAVYDRLEYIANEEGRQIDEIVREAVAEWLRERKA